MSDLSNHELAAIADLLDQTRNIYDGGLGPEPRARIFAAIDQPDRQTWLAARSVIVIDAPIRNLWRVVADWTGQRSPDFVPTGQQIIEALAYEFETQRVERDGQR